MKESRPARVVIVVEDNARDAELARVALASVSIPLRVTVVRDAEEAIRLFQGGRMRAVPDLVLTDVKLPIGSGFEVARYVRSTSALRFVPVVFFSSSRERADVTEAYLAGASSYAVKPVNFERFIERLSTIASYWLLHNESPVPDHDPCEIP